MNRRPPVLLLVAVVLLSSCAAPDEPARRFEAERARWHLDRLERRLGPLALASRPVREDLRQRHQGLAHRFGPDRPLGAGSRLGVDERLRYGIAGASALYAAELAARDGTDEKLRQEFDDIATRYAFDPDIAVRARVHEGLAWEAVGDAATALASFRAALEAPDPEDGVSPGWEHLRSDLELHVVLLLRDGPSRAAAIEAARTARARLTRRAETQTGPGERWIRRRLAEVCAASGDGDEAARIFTDLLSAPDGSDEEAEMMVRLGEVQELLRDQPSEAEALYRRAGAQAAGRPVGADARVHLGHLLRVTGRPREAVDVYALVIAASVAVDDPARAEALYGRGLAWDALTRWEDAIPAYGRGAAEKGPFAIACAAQLSHRFHLIEHPAAAEETGRFVARASTAANTDPPSPGLRDWAWLVRVDRESAAWSDVLEELDAIARERSGSVTDTAREARDRLASRDFVKSRFAAR